MARGRTILSVLVLALFALCLPQAQADLPIHCLNADVAGTWVFELSLNDRDSSEGCGYMQPDRNAQHFENPSVFDFHVNSRLKIKLTQPNIVTDERGNSGSWTMIYDEGFETVINGHSFFAFNKYEPKARTSLTSQEVSDYISHCGETMVGWYHDVPKNQKWGCFRGRKVDGSPVSMRMREKSVSIRHHNVVSPIKRNPKDDDALFAPNYALIEMINSDSRSTWKAKVHDEFLGKRHGDMMRLLGRRNYQKAHVATSSRTGSRSADVQKLGLPKEFSWTNVKGISYDGPVRNQGECGSCYAVAAIQVFESRLMIKSKGQKLVTFSPQEVVSCSRYNQGCDGGYPFLVGKHGEEFGFVTESCFPYEGSHGVCSRTCKNAKRYYMSNHTYVGGYYGACTEAEMMKEIYRAGPVVVAFQAPSSLFYYTGGIFTGPAPKSEGVRSNGVNIWEQTNHAVVAVGWGEESGVKYWLIKNTWGPRWGEGGYFRIRRGTDECGIESMASAFDIVL